MRISSAIESIATKEGGLAQNCAESLAVSKRYGNIISPQCRLEMTQRATPASSPPILDMVANEENFAFQQLHFGQERNPHGSPKKSSIQQRKMSTELRITSFRIDTPCSRSGFPGFLLDCLFRRRGAAPMRSVGRTRLGEFGPQRQRTARLINLPNIAIER